MRDYFALLFILALVLLLVVYYVGTASDLLIGAKVLQQLGYFLTARDSAGNWRPLGGLGNPTKRA